MITKTLNFTVVTGKMIEQIRAPYGQIPFDPDYGIASFIFTVPRSLSYEAAVREIKKKYPGREIVKNSIYVDHEQHCYTISIDDFIKVASLVK